MAFVVNSIGKVRIDEEGMFLDIDKAYVPALQGLDSFSHIIILWWFSHSDGEKERNKLLVPKPYRSSPELLGTFATRSPERPNPTAISTAQILHIDHDSGILQLAYIDADDGTPILDIKPYTPSLDRVESPHVPAWCAHWPPSCEQSGDFDWQSEFTFS